MIRRVVVTGMGALSALGCGAKQNYDALIQGKSAISSIGHIDHLSGFNSQVASKIITKTEDPINGFDISQAYQNTPSIKSLKKADNFILYAMIATQEAIDDSQIMEYRSLNKNRVGVSIGSGVAGVCLYEDTIEKTRVKGKRLGISPFFLPSFLLNMPSGYISIKYGFRGPNDSVVAACATGNYSIINAMRSILLNETDVMIAGSCEAPLSTIGVGGFCAMRALSTAYNDKPESASRPWDQGRDGFVIGEGAGTLVLEEYEHAKKRGAHIYAEITGYGASADASDITSPDPSGAQISMNNALSMHGKDNISYINAHGTSTYVGDISEIKAMHGVFGDNLSSIPISSTKSSTGHLLGAAGSVEAIYSIIALNNRVLPPTLNLHNPIDECAGLNMIPLAAQNIATKSNDIAVMSNSFGFGGTNTSIIFNKIDI
ncbi:MAG: beta-ketoacyl-ACP synthase II [Anaplasmataceae bacterium]|nr:beta-ketoacyl-ACP synthase II [Anaplasmataceae bacterium]